jgi:hypothetical protein
MKGVRGAVLALLATMGSAFAYPISMDIGAFAIDDYISNGGGMGNLGQMVAGGQNFFWAAQADVPPYAGSNTSAPTLPVDVRNTAVTKAAIMNTSSAYGNREYADFLYFGGHGLSGGAMYLGASDPPYGQVIPSNLQLGVGYNRWFLANSCSLFNGGNPATIWQPAFQGLKAMLGFKSFIFDNNLAWDLYNDFWLNWTSREKSLMNSFFDAEADYGYKYLYPTKGLEPGCLSAQYPGGAWDYCREFFRLVAHDYAKAPANTGYYYSKVIGSPQY